MKPIPAVLLGFLLGFGVAMAWKGSANHPIQSEPIEAKKATVTASPNSPQIRATASLPLSSPGLAQATSRRPLTALVRRFNRPSGGFGALFGTSLEIPDREITAALDLIGTTEDGMAKGVLAGNLLARWAKDDHAAVLSYAMASKDEGMRQLGIAVATRAWAQADLSAAVRWTEQLAPSKDRDAAIAGLLDELSLSNRTEAFRWAGLIASPSDRKEAFLAIYSDWAVTDPRAAIAQAQSLPLAEGRDGLVRALLVSWAQGDPRAAWEQAGTLPSSAGKADTLRSILTAWSQLNPADAAEAAMSGKFASSVMSGSSGEHPFLTVAERWARIDPEAAMTWARSLPSGVTASLTIAAVVRSIARNGNPQVALRYANELPASTTRESLMGDIGGMLVTQDPNAAISWAQSLPDGNEKFNTLAEISAAWARHDPAAAAVYATSLPTGRVRRQFITTVGEEWIAKDPEAGLSWVNSLPNEEPRFGILQSAIGPLAQIDPETAARIVSTVLPPGEQQQNAANTVISRWAQFDGAGAAAWASQFPEGGMRDAAWAQVARQWAFQDWTSTADWLRTLPDGPGRDGAIDSFVASVDGYDIQTATEWAGAIGNPEQRLAKLRSTFQRWLGENREAAMNWLEKSNLPAETRSRMLSQPPPPARQSGQRPAGGAAT